MKFFREAVKRIVPAFEDPNICPQQNENKEDAKIGVCAENLNVTIIDTRDHDVICFSCGYD